MPEVTREYAAKVLSALESKGNDLDSVNKQISTLSADEQKQFFTQAGQKLGLALEQTAAPKPSAKQMFEEGNPRASKILDNGEQVYANPVSATAAAGVAGLRGATSIPFIYDQGATDILSKTTGTSKEDAQDFQKSAEEQHPIVSALSEFAGGAVGAPKLAVEGTVGSIKLVAKGLKAAASALENTVVSGAAKFASKIGFPKLGKLASIIDDNAAMGTPKVVRQTASELEAAQSTVGKELEKVYSKVGQVIPKDMLYRGDDLATSIGDEILAVAKEQGKTLPKSFETSLRSEIDDVLGDLTSTKNVEGVKQGVDKVVTVNNIWKLAQETSRRINKFGRNASPTEATKADILDQIANNLYGKLSDHVTKAATLSGDATLVKNAEVQANLYKELSTGARVVKAQLKRINKKESVQIASDRAAEILSKGQKLGKFYKRLAGANASRGLPGVATMHAHMLKNNEEYNSLIQSLDNKE